MKRGKGKEDNTIHKQSLFPILTRFTSFISSVVVTGWVEGSDVTLGVWYPIVHAPMHAWIAET